MTELTPRQIAAKKAWETMRANKARTGSLKGSTASAPKPVVPAPVAIVATTKSARKPKVLVNRSVLIDEAPTMNAAQKAHETRRIEREARERLEILKVGVQTVSPHEDAAMVQLYVDDSRVGCGFRQFVVLEIGKKAVKLFQPSQLATVRVDRITFDRYSKPVRCPKKTVRRIIRSAMESADKFSLGYNASNARAALAAVR